MMPREEEDGEGGASFIVLKGRINGTSRGLTSSLVVTQVRRKGA